MKLRIFCAVVAATLLSVSVAAALASHLDGDAPKLQQKIMQVIEKVRPACAYKGTTSGVLLSHEGGIYYLTNWHCVGSAMKFSKEWAITVPGAGSFETELLGYAPGIDAALFKVKDAGNLPSVEFADSDAVKAGDLAITAGVACNLQYGGYDIVPPGFSIGVVGALRTGRSIGDSILTDASINFGNSGGALFTLDGKYLGLIARMSTRVWTDENGANSFKGSFHTGLGFCVPANTLKRYMKSLIAGGFVSGGRYGGISGLTLSRPDKRAKGVLVDNVRSNSSAESAGFKAGDKITHVNSQKVNTPRIFKSAVSSYPLGTEITVTVVRNGSSKKISATVEMVGRGW